MRTSTITQSRAHPRRCSGCGKSARESFSTDLAAHPRRRAELLSAARAIAADLEVDWLVPVTGGYAAARYCCDCAPVGCDVLALDCGECGMDAPIVLLDDAALPGIPAGKHARERALEHLRGHGWRVDGDASTCPHCAGGHRSQSLRGR